MSTTLIKRPKIMLHPVDDAGNNSTAKETTRLIPSASPPKQSSIAGGDTIDADQYDETHHHLSYLTILFLMLNRSINLVLYKAFTTFSYYFSEYFGMNYTLFALIAVMNFPGNLLNIAVVPYYHQFKVRYVIVFFELILAASCLLILPWHSVTGLLVARLMTGFAITAARSEVNATIGAFTHGKRRTRSIGIVEMSFGFSAMGFLVVGTVLQYFGWRVFFVGSACLVVIIAILCMFIVPAWNIEYGASNYSKEIKKNEKKKYSYLQLREALMHKRLQLVFLSVLLNKIARNAFYYTFSKWLSLSYGLGPQQAGYITLCVAGGCLIGTTIVPLIVTKLSISIHMACLFGAMMQVASMITEPIYVLFGHHVSLFGACVVIFFYFAGCQIWYNNILDILMGVTPRKQLLPAVNTILLAYGAFGGMIGTIGSTVWYEWGGEAAIATICAASNVGVCCIVILLWIAHKQHPYLTQKTNKIQDEDEDKKRRKGIKNYQSIAVTVNDEDRDNQKVPKLLADSSGMALRIIDGTQTPKQSQSRLLQNIHEDEEEDEDDNDDENEDNLSLLNHDNDIHDANRI